MAFYLYKILVLNLGLAHALYNKCKHALDLQSDATAALGHHDRAIIKAKWDDWVQKSVLQPNPHGGRLGAMGNAKEKLRVAVGIYDIITHAFKKQGNGMLCKKCYQLVLGICFIDNHL